MKKILRKSTGLFVGDCGYCGTSFAYELEDLRNDMTVICPVCGASCSHRAHMQLLPEDLSTEEGN